MSKMADLDLDIQNFLEQGKNPVEIANLLEIPITWVYETSSEQEKGNTEVYSPFVTINS